MHWAWQVKLLSWMTDLQKKSASDELSEAEIRQLLFDIETAYQSFHSHLSAGRPVRVSTVRSPTDLVKVCAPEPLCNIHNMPYETVAKATPSTPGSELRLP
eukprot:scaffold382_cov380-Prasinococcus_capsulatus_cf.AAC.33